MQGFMNSFDEEFDARVSPFNIRTGITKLPFNHRDRNLRFHVIYNHYVLLNSPNAWMVLVSYGFKSSDINWLYNRLSEYGLSHNLSKVEFAFDLLTSSRHQSGLQHYIDSHIYLQRSRSDNYYQTTHYLNQLRQSSKAVVVYTRPLPKGHSRRLPGEASRVRVEYQANRRRLRLLNLENLQDLLSFPFARLLDDMQFVDLDLQRYNAACRRRIQRQAPNLPPRAPAIAESAIPLINLAFEQESLRKAILYKRQFFNGFFPLLNCRHIYQNDFHRDLLRRTRRSDRRHGRQTY